MKLKDRELHQHCLSLGGNKIYIAVFGAGARRMRMNRKIHFHISKWSVSLFKNIQRFVGVFCFFFSPFKVFVAILGCIGSCRCPKHPTRRGRKRPGLLPLFFPSPFRPCKDVHLPRYFTEHVSIYPIYLSIPFKLIEYQAVAPSPAVVSISIF